MARFGTYADVDIDVDEFLDGCDSTEISEVIQWLRDTDNLIGGVDVTTEDKNIMEIEFDEALSNLSEKRFRMTTEDEQTILDISKKYS